MKSAGKHTLSGFATVMWAAARSTAYVTFIVALLAAMTAFLARAARAEIDETLLDMGSDLVRFPGAPHGQVREVRVNGARVSLRAQSVEASLARVLSDYEKACAESNARVFRALGEAVGGPVSHAAPALGALVTSSGRRGNRGYVACADFGDSSDLEGVLQRLLGVAQGGDLNGIGSLRYVYVEGYDTGGQERSLVVAISTSSSSLLRRLVPQHGRDAEGRDMQGLPRPSDLQRLLSAWEVDGPSGVFSYVTDAHSPAELESFYRAALPGHGWKVLHRYPGESTEIDRIRMLSAEKERHLITVLAHPAAQARTILTILASETP